MLATEDLVPPTFTEQIEQGLENFNQVEWLGEHSPLAAPYFLGELLASVPDALQPAGRGRVLQSVLVRAALGERGAVDPTLAEQNLPELLLRLSQGTAQQRLIYWKYCHQPKPTAQTIAQQLSVSRAEYYRDLKERLPETITQLARAVLGLIQPTLHLELPPVRPLVGREELLVASIAALQAHQSVALLGPSGIGKTALGAAVAAAWPGPVFWFTLRLGLNDQLDSLVFALGYFLHQQGASQLWLQLVADGGKINTQVAASLALATLGSLPKRPLLCFDDLDLLRPNEVAAHAPIHTLLEALAAAALDHAPLLYVGQQLRIPVDQHFTLPGLAPSTQAAWLTSVGLPLSAGDQQRLHDYTQGNPQLLKLFALLAEAGDPVPTVLQHFATAPTLTLLLSRLQARLGPEEQALLVSLAVFRRAAPADGWPEAQAGLAQLIARGLVQLDQRGGVRLWTAVREAIYAQLQPADRQQVHANAATIRASRGEYTAAAYHYVQAGQPAQAVRTWFPHREQEVQAGQAQTALALFAQIAHTSLPPADQQALVLLRVELYKLTGAPDAALDDLQAVKWSAQDPLTAYARQLWGDVLEAQSQPEAAQAHYAAALRSVTGRLERQEVQLHAKLGSVALSRLRDQEQAWHEARIASYIAEDFQGDVQDERGHYAAAETHYRRALAIAEELKDGLRQARAHNNLGLLATRREDRSTALHHYGAALRYYEQVGDWVRLERTRTNVVMLHVQIGDYAAAVEPALQALHFFERGNYANWVAINVSNLAEAYCGLEQLNQASHFAQLALAAEEPAIIPYALTVLAEIERKEQRLTNAAQQAQMAIAQAEEIGDRWAAANAWRILAKTFADQHEPSAAQSAAATALAIYQALGLVHEIARTSALLASFSSPPR